MLANINDSYISNGCMLTSVTVFSMSINQPFRVIVTNLDKLKVRKMGDLSKNFSREEFKCKCNCGFATADIKLIHILEVVRNYFNAPVTINSGCRCEAYNDKIGGSYGSKHKQGIAADIVVSGVNPERVYKFLDGYVLNKYGVGKYDGFTHIDVATGKSRRWNSAKKRGRKGENSSGKL